MIFITSSGPVGVKYMVDGLGALPKYDSDDEGGGGGETYLYELLMALYFFKKKLI